MKSYFDFCDLRFAVREGRAEDVRGFLQGGADVETAGLALGSTLLHEAAAANNISVIDVLLEAGAKLDRACEIDGWTPLHVAAENGAQLAALALLKGGADENRLDNIEQAPIHLAALGGHTSVVTALGSGFGHLEHSALGVAACHRRVGVVTAVVEGGGDVNGGDSTGYSALHDAAATNKVEMLTVLLSLGADIEARDVHGMSALHFASSGGHCEAALVLLDHGANEHALDSNNDSPLHWAACPSTRNFTPMLVNLLLERGADETLRNYQGNSPADLVEAAPPARNEYMYETWEKKGGEDNRNTVLRLLLHADVDRKYRTSWRHRRWLVLCRTWPDRVILNPSGRSANDETAPSSPAGGVVERTQTQTDDADAPAMFPHCQRPGCGCDEEGKNSDESSALLAWVVGLREEGLFRTISGFL